MQIYKMLACLPILIGLPLLAGATDYRIAGVVNQVNSDEGNYSVVIDFVEYQLTPDVTSHSLIPFGERGPELQPGMRVGINTRSDESGQHQITDIWILSDE